MENNLRCSFSRSNGRAILIVLYPRVSHAVYLDPTRNYEKKDFTHVMNILDEAHPRNDFFRIQRDIATIIIKEVVDEKGIFHHGPISRDDVRTRVGVQRQDLRPFTKLGDILPDLDGWNF
jgi:hypothetical protein